ncbi:hypothetical protein SAMN04487987_11115 [Algibacter pectinivorans]|uniref:Uncharacterized protein n=1 Tax=Algibacter pectinivorans TaxID=870482 RepID=A0A1I1RRH5_9FLAO|nr:hypothetical protein SAMN04487987_11115 [Algibacter pectinivorans]
MIVGNIKDIQNEILTTLYKTTIPSINIALAKQAPVKDSYSDL